MGTLFRYQNEKAFYLFDRRAGGEASNSTSSSRTLEDGPLSNVSEGFPRFRTSGIVFVWWFGGRILKPMPPRRAILFLFLR